MKEGHRRQHLDEIGLAIDLNECWPVHALAGSGATGVYQPIAETSGIVFVRYGAEETVDQYLQKLGGMLTEVSIEKDESVSYCGKEGRRVTVRLTTQPREMYRTDLVTGVSHHDLPTSGAVISVIGIAHRDRSILVGYRMPAEFLATYENLLTAIINSVELS